MPLTIPAPSISTLLEEVTQTDAPTCARCRDTGDDSTRHIACPACLAGDLLQRWVEEMLPDVEPPF